MDKKKLKKTILDKIAQLETEIKEIKKLAAPIEPENAIGRISRMDAINNKTINDRLLRNAAEKQKKLKSGTPAELMNPNLDFARYVNKLFRKLDYATHARIFALCGVCPQSYKNTSIRRLYLLNYSLAIA